MPRTKLHPSKDEPEKDPVGELLEGCPQIDPKEACGNYPKTKLNQEAMKLHVNAQLEQKLTAINGQLAGDKIQIILKLIGDRVYLWDGDKEVTGRNFPFTTDGLADAEEAVRDLVKLEQQLVNINQNLKGTRVSLRRVSNYVYLRATLPLKPGDTPSKANKKEKQYDLTINGRGLPFTTDGLKLADKEAQDLGLLIAHNVFVWNEKYLSNKSSRDEGEDEEKPKTIRELLVEFEQLYFGKRPPCRQSKGTFDSYMAYLPKLPQDVPLTEKLILDTIFATDTGSAKRVKLVSALSVFCNTIKFTFDFTGYRNGYKPKARVLPTDDEVEETYFNSFYLSKHCPKEYQENYLGYQWIYGMLAAYGLRPQEVFAVDFDESFKDDLNSIWLNPVITDGIKTDARWVFPLRPDWVELFELKNLKLLVSEGKLKSKVQMVAQYFRVHNITFPPYNLRHAMAVRGHRMGIPIKEVADNMGHSVNQHTNTYQRWMTLDDRKEVYTKAINRIKETQNEKSKVDQLQELVALLESEVRDCHSQLKERDTQLDELTAYTQELMADNQQLHSQLEDCRNKPN